jgi:hypothetical protein
VERNNGDAYGKAKPASSLRTGKKLVLFQLHKTEELIKLKKSNAAAVLTCIIGAFALFQFVSGVAAVESFTQM